MDKIKQEKIRISFNFTSEIINLIKEDVIVAQNAEDRSCITQFELGEMFEKDDSARNYPSAFKWYLRSAKHGYRKAQHRLGTMYARGVGVTRNYIEAYAWCKVSAAQHSRRAILKLKKIEPHLSAEQISTARKLSRQYYEMYVAPSANQALIRE